MCRNIKPLYHFDPPASDDEIRAAALQFVRKVSGFAKPSQTNQGAFEQAVDEVTAAVQTLLNHGTIYAVEPDEMPDNGSVAAVFRY